MAPFDFIQAPEVLNRRVLFAVELVDPVTRALVWRGLQVRAEGIANRPILSGSGRFVWLSERDAWPTAISVVPRGVPYAPHRQPGPQRPADLEKATAEQRRVTIVLRPTRAYPFAAGLTAIRGRLREDASPSARPIAGARVQLAWKRGAQWLPPPPDPIPGPHTSPAEVQTDADGEFAVFLRIAPSRDNFDELAARKKALLEVRLQITRDDIAFTTLVTPPAFPFLKHPDPPGHVIEGQLLARDLSLAWSDLKQSN